MALPSLAMARSAACLHLVVARPSAIALVRFVTFAFHRRKWHPAAEIDGFYYLQYIMCTGLVLGNLQSNFSLSGLMFFSNLDWIFLIQQICFSPMMLSYSVTESNQTKLVNAITGADMP